MPKPPAQLDREIASALASQDKIADQLARIEAAVDAHPELTRERKNGFVDDAELTFSRRGWTARCLARNRLAKGRGAQQMSDITGDGPTAEAAADKLIEMLPFWTTALKK